MGKSGLGAAMRHQRDILRARGVELVPLGKRPDVVILNTVFLDSVLAGLFARLTGARVVSFAHSTREDFRNSWAGANAVAPLFGAWLALAYRVGHVIVTPTPYSARLLRPLRITNPVHVLSNGVDTTFFAPNAAGGRRFRERHGLGPEDQAVVSVGHQMVRKGIVDFVELARRIPEARFFWFGHTSRVALSDAARTAIDSAPANLQFPGYVPVDQVRDAYAGADLFCFPSYEETEGIVVLEALATGAPSLIRDIPVYEDWLPGEEVVYKARSLDEFETKARAMLDGELPDLTATAVQRMQRHSLEAVGERFLAICAGTGR